MKVRLILDRHYTKQYSLEEYAMGTECKTIVIDLPNIENDTSRKNSSLGEWQIVGYEEIEDSEGRE